MQREEGGDKGDTKIYCCNNFFILFFFIYIYIFFQKSCSSVYLLMLNAKLILIDFYC